MNDDDDDDNFSDDTDSYAFLEKFLVKRKIPPPCTLYLLPYLTLSLEFWREVFKFSFRTIQCLSAVSATA